MLVKYFKDHLYLPFAPERIISEKLKTVVVSDELPTKQEKSLYRYFEKARFDFDTAGRVLKTTIWDNLQNLNCQTTEYAYNETGNLVWERTHIAWYSEGKGQEKLVEAEYVVQALHYEWHEGRCVAKTMETPAEGGLARRMETYQYNPAGQKTETRRTPASTDAPASTETYEYDELGRLVCSVDKDPATEQAFERTYRYDAAGRLTEESRLSMSKDNEAGELRWQYQEVNIYEYDAAGNLICHKTVERNDAEWSERYETHYSYDDQNRLVREIWPMRHGNGVTLSFYDDMNRLIRKEISAGSKTTDILEYQYDERGLCVAICLHGKPSHRIRYETY